MPLQFWDVLKIIIPHLGNTTEGYIAPLVVDGMLIAVASSRFIIDTPSTFKTTPLLVASGTSMTVGAMAGYVQVRTRQGIVQRE